MNIQQTISTIKKNFSYLLVGEIIIRLAMLLLVISLAQTYGPDSFGEYSLALSIGGLFEILFNYGLGTTFLQKVCADPDKLSEEFSIYLPLKLISGAVSLVAAPAFTFLMNKDSQVFTSIIYGSVFYYVLSLFTFLTCTFDSRQKMHLTSIVKLIQYTIIVSAGFILIFYQQPISQILLWHLLGTIIATIITLLIIDRKFTPIKFNFNFPAWKNIIKLGFPIALSGTFIYLYNYLDSIIISIMKGDYYVGIYQVSYKVIGTIFVLAVIINQSYFPALIKEAKDKNTLSEIFNRSLQNLLFWSIPITIGGFVLADKIILTIFGPKFTAGIPAFRILIFNCIIYFLSSAFTQLLFAVNQQKKVMKVFFAGALINTVSNIFIIPSFGIEGASLTTILAELVVLFGTIMVSKKFISFELPKNLFPIIISGLIMLLSILALNIQSLVLAICIGALVYFGSYFPLMKLKLTVGPPLKKYYANIRKLEDIQDIH